MDITDNIPGMFLTSGAPTAPPRVGFGIFRAALAPPERAVASHPGYATRARIKGFPLIFKDFWKFSKIMIFTPKIKVAKSIRECF